MKSLRISLRAGERIYVNGAVLQPDRKVSLEFLNDVVFLLESHVIQAEETTTPLRQVYFIAQTMLLVPASRPAALQVTCATLKQTLNDEPEAEFLQGLTGALLDPRICPAG